MFRGIERNFGGKYANTFHDDLHPPFNDNDWGQPSLVEDSRWKYGLPPAGNANYAWLSHMVDKLSQNGKAAIVLANGSLSTNTSNEGENRKHLINADLV